MRRAVPLLLAAGALAALGYLVRGSVETRPRLAGTALAPEPAGAPAVRAVPPPADPQALASWFESEVLRELEERTAGGGSPQRTAAAPGWGEAAGASEGIDWDYVVAVFQGRVSGIPDERRAGISLKQMDELGDIPYVEALRHEGRIDELRDLGFEPVVLEAPAPSDEARFPLNPRLEPTR